MLGAVMKREDQDLLRRMSVSLMAVAMALALQALRPALAGDAVRMRPDGAPKGVRAKPQSVTVGGRIRYAPVFGGNAISVPPLAGSDGDVVVDCIAGCYAPAKLASVEAVRLEPASLTPVVAEPVPVAAEEQEGIAPPVAEREAPAEIAPARLKPSLARQPGSRETRSRFGGSGDWFRRINDDRDIEIGR